MPTSRAFPPTVTFDSANWSFSHLAETLRLMLEDNSPHEASTEMPAVLTYLARVQRRDGEPSPAVDFDLASDTTQKRINLAQGQEQSHLVFVCANDKGINVKGEMLEGTTTICVDVGFYVLVTTPATTDDPQESNQT